MKPVPPFRVVRHLAAGVLGAWAVLGLEISALLSLRGKDLAGVWELQMGLLGLTPAWALVGVLPGLFGACFAWPTAHVEVTPQAPGWTLRGRAAWWWGQLALAALFGFAVGYGVGGGRHLAAPGARLGFALAVAATSATALMLGKSRMRRWEASGQLGWLTGSLLTLLALLAIEVANSLLLVRLYPAFHLGLSFAALALGGYVGARAWCASRVYPAAGTLVLAIAAAMLLPKSSQLIAGFDNFRWLVSESSPTLATGVDLSGRLSPPPTIDASARLRPLGARRDRSGVDLSSRSILLLSIDAVRADHVGAYGYERPTTPHLDKLASTGVLFERAYAPTPHTSYSVTSLMTGKYMRPLLLQGAGADSDVWAALMQTYGYRTAAFYPPAVFFIDGARFNTFRESRLGFEYAKIEFAEGEKRIGQVARYLEAQSDDQPLFIWVHLFGPHEPYIASKGGFGQRDVDRYDDEIREADRTVGRIVKLFRQYDPRGLVMVTSDHGEEFGDHGGRYHGTTVYEEQVRVPLVINAEGLAAGRRVHEPVQTIDLLPTVLAALSIPTPPRVRGRSLTTLLAAQGAEPARAATPSPPIGFAHSETDTYTMFAEASFRLICQRRSGACQLFDISKDPGQTRDISRGHSEVVSRLRATSRALASSHGEYESQGLRAEGKGWPTAIVRGLTGEADAAPALALLLEDADPAIRAKSAELLFALATTAQAPALRLALGREDNSHARAWLALSLTRLGQGAPLVQELLRGDDRRFRRLAALALAMAGDGAGEDVLIGWWLGSAKSRTYEDDLQLIEAFARIRGGDAVGPLASRLDEVRLRPSIASALARIGDRDARPHLALHLRRERYHSARPALAQALLDLGADDELVVPLRRFLGVPDPMQQGLEIAKRAGILEDIGGPATQSLRRLHQLSDSGVSLTVTVPPQPKHSPEGTRLLVRARSDGPGQRVLVAPAAPRRPLKDGAVRARNQPTIDTSQALALAIPLDGTWHEVFALLGPEFGSKPGHALGLAVFAERGVEVEALAVLPLRAELPPPAPKPWKPPSSAEEGRRDAMSPTEAH